MPEMSPLGVFFRERVSFFFFFFIRAQRRACTPTHIYGKYHVSTRFLIKIIFFHFPPKKNHVSGKNKYHLSRYYKKGHVRAQISWKDHLSRTPEEYRIYSYFLRKIIFPFVSMNKIIFSGKKPSFLIIQERLYSSAIFLERPCFQNIWKKKIWFFVQCMGLLFLLVWPVILVDFGNRTILLSKPFPTISFPLRSVKLGYL